jgi:KTSC domain
MPSSVVQAMRYEPLRRMLEIVFRGGRGRYRYFEVSMEEWRRFRDAPSKGTYLNERFKAKAFHYQKVQGSVAEDEQKDARHHRESKREAKKDAEPLEWGEATAFPKPPAQRYS